MKRNRRSDVAGLAIYGDFARYIRLRRENGALRAVCAEQLTLHGGADDAARAIAGLKKRLGDFSCPVVLGIPSVGVKTELLRYPAMPLSEVRDSLVTDFDRVSPYPPDDSLLDVVTVSAGEKEHGMKVLAVISRRATVEAVLTAAERAGMSVSAVEPLNMAVFRAAGEQTTLDDACFMAWRGPCEFDMALKLRGTCVFYRSVPLDGTADIAQAARHIRETAAFVETGYRDVEVRDLFIGGELNDMPRLAGLLSGGTPLKVHPMSMDLPHVESDFDISGFEAAIALALRGSSRGPCVDMRPAGYAGRERRRHSFSFTRAAAALLLSAFCVSNVCCVLSALLRTVELSRAVDVLKRNNAGLKSRMAPLLAEVSGLKDRERNLLDTIAFMEGEMPSVEVMNAIEENAMPGTRLSEISFTAADGGYYFVSVEALSETDEGIITLAEGLMRSGVFSSVTVPASQKDEASGKMKFTLNMTAKPFGLINAQWGGAE